MPIYQTELIEHTLIDYHCNRLQRYDDFVRQAFLFSPSFQPASSTNKLTRCLHLFEEKSLSLQAKMRRRHCISWFLTALFAVILAVVTNSQKQETVPVQNQSKRTESSVMSPLRQQRHEATLTDATQLYRICSSRPHRILPTQGSRSERTLTPGFNLVRLHHVKRLHSYFDSRCRLESAPFCLSSSCDYYVIALRHIIR